LSIFFTNHVAALLHRFLRDLVPDGPGEHQPDPTQGEFIVTAMDLFDAQLRRILAWIRMRPNRVLVVASSMGQGPLPRRTTATTYVLDDHHALATALALPECERERCMYPRITLRFANADEADEAAAAVGSVVTGCGDALFRDLRVSGRTISFEISYRHDVEHLPAVATWQPLRASSSSGRIAELGVAVKGRSFGGDSGGHTPEGMVLMYGDGIRADVSRVPVSVLDAAPSLCALLGVPPDPSMRGEPSLVPAR